MQAPRPDRARVMTSAAALIVSGLRSAWARARGNASAFSVALGGLDWRSSRLRLAGDSTSSVATRLALYSGFPSSQYLGSVGPEAVDSGLPSPPSGFLLGAGLSFWSMEPRSRRGAISRSCCGDSERCWPPVSAPPGSRRIVVVAASTSLGDSPS